MYQQFKFFSCDYLRYELNKHHNKLKHISKLTDEEIEESKYRITNQIQFINLEIIPKQIWYKAENLVTGVDIDDIDFIALTIFLNGFLWTGDMQLYNGMISRGFSKIINTTELWEKSIK